MKVLFIGGTGVISSACTAYALSQGIDVFHLNRGQTHLRNIPDGVTTLKADVRNERQVREALGDHRFDAVVDWIAYTPEHVAQAIRLLAGRTGQYVLISSASAYQKPPQKVPVTEETPLENPYWEYARQKIACERLLTLDGRIPYTIIRPSHTYDKTKVPLIGGFTTLQRIKRGEPVVVHGDGTSLWTLTHSTDFAPGLVGLLGKQAAMGEAYHITSDEWLSWNQIYDLFGKALGKEPKIVHVPSGIIAQYNREIGDGLLGDKMHSMLFDNTKIRTVVPEFDPKIPFAEGVEEIVNYYAEGDHNEMENASVHQMMDAIVSRG